MKLQSIGEVLYEPESYDELVSLVTNCKKQDLEFYIVAKGSNVVFGEHVRNPIVSLLSLNNNIALENGCINCGCSVKIQKLIRFAQENDMGGIEYLYSLPASVGGCIYMNAGRGKTEDQCISNYLEEVVYLDLEDMVIKTERVDKQLFSYRHSPYQDKSCIILSGRFRFIHQSKDETESLIKKRLERVSQLQDASIPSCGSVFCVGNRMIYHLFKWLGINSGDACFSKKSPNWISNRGKATLSDVKYLIHKMESVHQIFGCKSKVEIKIFE